jgi:multidrug efflux pump subunit AcrA (membrane-fusion protein)
MPRDEDELSFAELMAREGVARLDGRPLDGRGAGPARTAPKADAGRPAPGRPETSSNAPAAATAGVPAAGRAAAPPVDLAAENTRLAQAESRAAAAEARAAAAEARAAAAEARAAQAEARAAAAEAILQQTRQAAAAAEQAQHALDAERRGLAEQSRRLRAALTEHEHRAAEQLSLREVLSRRGLADTGEMVEALQGMLAQRPEDLLDVVELTSPGPLMNLLDQGLALVHDPASYTLGDTSVVVRVPPERCEITGGSDIRASFHHLITACEHAGVSALTVVGGSPAYRQQLATLAAPHRPTLRLNLVSGTRRREKRRAEADMRKSDLVVIWSATELDHSVSALYSGNSAPIVHVPHRGISRMLDHVAEWLEARRT